MEIRRGSNLSKPRYSGPQKYQIHAAYRAKAPHEASHCVKKHFAVEKSLFGVYQKFAKGSLQRPSEDHFPPIFEIYGILVELFKFNFEPVSESVFVSTFKL